ncbi:hypothetical protein [Alterinioella nitratireducens]|uniref:hypothetical protein n=1 Tax=Alterinioella nitratireducens TaxID=2735915 RepID=UPI001F3284D8|nr:hypothetical protein [Alterinioella nitratireducens]
MPKVESCRLLSDFGQARVARSREASPSMAITAQIALGSNPARPGRRMISTPTSPIRIADQRRQPTRSPKTSAAPIATTSGAACKIAVTSDKGVSVSASTMPQPATISEI